MTTTHLKKSIGKSSSPLALLLIPLVFACFALCPMAQAVSPPPDGAYPGGNTAEGLDALFSLTTGAWNTALGYNALNHDTTGGNNTAVGFSALLNNDNGKQNTAVGDRALGNNETGGFNTAVGAQALFANSSGGLNCAFGNYALFANNNYENCAFGFNALRLNTSGNDNTANGAYALDANTSGSSNTADGAGALTHNTIGGGNTAIGRNALYSNTTGGANIAIGHQAGMNLTGGDDNIDIGNEGVAGEGHTIRIGSQQNQSDTFVSGIYGRPVGPAPLTVMCGSDGKLTANASSRRFKHDIKPIDKASEAILALKPVTFLYNEDPTNTPWFGLIAEDVAEVNPDLIVRDKEGKPFSVRYEQVNAMLLNEFLKEHKKVEQQDRRIREQETMITQLKNELQATAASQQKQIESLNAGLQKVSAQLELNKAAPQTVLNNQ